jgi:hypothetical protein
MSLFKVKAEELPIEDATTLVGLDAEERGVRQDVATISATRTTTGPVTGAFTRKLIYRDYSWMSIRDLGATENGASQQDRYQDLFQVAYNEGIKNIINDGSFISDGPMTLQYPVNIYGRSQEDRLRINTDNTAPGLLISKTSNLSIRNFDLAVYSANDITNGTGHNGTCITTCDWFPNPLTQEETIPVKNIIIDSMRLSRIEGGTGHALAFLSRSRNIRVNNCKFIGASDTSPHGDAVLCHWGAWSNGVSTASIYYDGLSVPFTEGRIVRGLSSGGEGYITKIEDLGGGTGRLCIKEVRGGAFQNNEGLVDTNGGSATADGGTWVYQLAYDGGSGTFSIGQTVTGTGGTPPTATIAHITVLSGTTGILHLSDQSTVSSTFTDNMVITTGTGSALCNGVRSNTGLVQSPFLPSHYSFHPNGIYITNCEAEYTQRMIALSSCYDVHVDNFRMNDPNCVQLVDLPIGDEGETFAHPEDFGQVYSNFSFTNITCPYSGGSGGNGVTAIDISGVNTSKQLDADLAAYAGSAYAGMRYRAVQPRARQFYWQAVSFDNIVWDAGPRDPASSTDYVRQIWIRNTIGDFSFSNIYAKGHDSPTDPGGVPLALTIDNFRGIASFNNMNMYGGVYLRDADGVWINDTKISQPQDDVTNGEPCVEVFGSLPSYTTTAAGFALGATTVTLSSPVTTRFNIGTPLKYPTGTVFVSKWVETGDTVVNITPVEIANVAAVTATFDRTIRNTRLNDVKLTGGRRGIAGDFPGKVKVSGGSVRRMTQYAAIAASSVAGTTGVIEFDGTDVRQNGTVGVSSYNFVMDSGGAIYFRNGTIGDNQKIDRNVVCLTGWRGGAIIDSIIEDNPITSQTSIAASSTAVFDWRGNVDNSGARLAPLSWSPQLRVGGTPLADQTTEGTYSISGDEVTLWFNITVNAVAALTGSLTVAGNPCPAATSTHEGMGVMKVSDGLLISTTPFPRMGVSSSVFALNRHDTGTFVALTDANIKATTNIRGWLKYRIN